MSLIEPYLTMSPYSKEENCAKFTIDEPSLFVMPHMVIPGEEYTYSMWAKADADGSVTVEKNTLSVTTQWRKYSVTFTSTSEDVSLQFMVPGTYYIFHAQLEIGNQCTDWTPSPEDQTEEMETRFSIEADKIEAQITTVNKSIDELGRTVEEKYSKTIVEDINGITIKTNADSGAKIIDTGAWELGAIRDTGDADATNRLRMINSINLTTYREMTIAFDANVYKVAVYYYADESTESSLNTPDYDTTGEIIVTSATCPETATHMRIMLARVDDAVMTVEESNAVTIFGPPRDNYELRLDNETGVTILKNGEVRSQLIDDYFYTGNIFVETYKQARFGNFAFVPRSDGSLSFLKVGG